MNFQEFLESAQPIDEIIRGYIRFGESPAGIRELGTRLSNAAREAGNCSMVSYSFKDWVAKNHPEVHVRIAVGEGNLTNLRIPVSDDGSAIDAHTVPLIGMTIIDFTARQFDLRATYPRIFPLSTFRKEWKHVQVN